VVSYCWVNTATLVVKAPNWSLLMLCIIDLIIVFVHFAMCTLVQIIVGRAAQNGLNSEGER